MNRISRLRVRSVAATGAEALAGQEALVRACQRAVEAVAPAESVVVLRRIDLSFVADVAGGAPSLERDLELAIRDRLAAVVDDLRARAGHAAAFVANDGAWFASVGVFHAEELRACARPAAWPFDARPADVLWAELATIERSEAATALAHLAREGAVTEAHDRPGEVPLLGVPAPSAGKMRELLRRWLVDGRPLGCPDVSDELKRELWRALPREDEASVLARTALLFARWPPSRDLPIVREVVERPPPTHVSSRERTIRTEATGLLVMASWYGAELERLVADYAEERARRGFLLALGVALEDPRLRLDDPVLALFAGERPRPAGLPLGLLDALDPEPGHAATLREVFAEAEVSVSIASLGDAAQVFTEGVLVDEVASSSAHDAVDAVAARLCRWLGRAPTEITVLDRCPEVVIDRWTEVDGPRLPERWRPAARCAASLLATRWEREQGSTLRALRGRGGHLRETREGFSLALDDPHGHAPCSTRIALRGGAVVWLENGPRS
ncbi:MAG: hypothetical protein KF901_21700 [Myxococcales bacterium]|nr:hypothetical protein [Myxococcales bacterium]